MNYKNEAVLSLSGKWGLGAIMALTFFIIYYVPILLTDDGLGLMRSHFGSVLCEGLWRLLMVPLAWKFDVIFLSIAQREDVKVGNLFDGFRQFFRIFWTQFLKSFYLFCWYFLLIIPGLIRTYSYAMTDFILQDTDLSFDAAIEYSSKLMDGHKGELFLLDLSFVGWFILSILTLGIGFLFSYPCWMTARAHFYEHLKEGFKENSGQEM